MRNALFSLLLGMAVVVSTPVGVRADDRDHRYYEDREHHDRHEWNEAEARAWRHWLMEERHREYHDWERANARERREYWRWRHEHADWK